MTLSLGAICTSRVALGAPSRHRQARWLALAIVVCVLLSSAAGGVAKQKKKISRTVSGVVLDGTENPIVGASVELTDVTSGKKVAIYSTDGGHYQFSDLDPLHDYEVKALNQNISSGVHKVSTLDDRNNIVVILRIPPPKE